MTALFVALAWLLFLGTLGLAFSRVAALRRLVTPEGLAASLRKKRPAERREALVAAAPPRSWARAWAEALGDEPDPARRASLTDLALAELERDLDASERWPASAARLAGLGGLLLAVLAYLAGAPAGGIAAGALAGAFSLVLALAAGRRAARMAAQERERADALVDALGALFASGASDPADAALGAEESRGRRPARAWRSWGRRG